MPQVSINCNFVRVHLNTYETMHKEIDDVINNTDPDSWVSALKTFNTVNASIQPTKQFLNSLTFLDAQTFVDRYGSDKKEKLIEILFKKLNAEHSSGSWKSERVQVSRVAFKSNFSAVIGRNSNHCKRKYWNRYSLN
jgi:hypothetical protein